MLHLEIIFPEAQIKYIILVTFKFHQILWVKQNIKHQWEKMIEGYEEKFTQTQTFLL